MHRYMTAEREFIRAILPELHGSTNCVIHTGTLVKVSMPVQPDAIYFSRLCFHECFQKKFLQE